MPDLVGCEYSQTVTSALRAVGREAYSCDIDDTDGNPDWHIKRDIMEVIPTRRWDIIILHPECTAMGVCGNRYYAYGTDGMGERIKAIQWTLKLWHLAKQYSDKVALENPASVIFPELKRVGARVQYVQPWQFGHPEQKKTGFALHGIEPLIETNNVYDEMMKLPKKERERVFYMSPGEDRGKERARFFPGIASAMAEQWI